MVEPQPMWLFASFCVPRHFMLVHHERQVATPLLVWIARLGRQRRLAVVRKVREESGMCRATWKRSQWQLCQEGWSTSHGHIMQNTAIVDNDTSVGYIYRS